MNNKPLVVAGINFKNIKLAYLLTGIVMGVALLQNIVFLVLASFDINPSGPENATVSFGNLLFLLVIFTAVFVPVKNFRKMMNLGGKRADFFRGCIINYAIIAALISLVSLILYYTYDKYMISALYGGGTLDILYWFRWLDNGPVVAFFRQFAFLFLLATVIHTLTAIQDKWYGWGTDILIVAIISVFTPISALRPALVWFFNLIIFHSNALLQIIACIILSLLVYSLNKPIFARKVI